jgi:hypothetical protein
MKQERIQAEPANTLESKILTPSVSAIRATAGSLRSDALIVFPVRHHSPACAWQLRQLFAELDAAGRTPSAVLIEGPRGFSDLLPLLAREDAQMPLAIYTYAVMRSERDAALENKDKPGEGNASEDANESAQPTAPRKQEPQRRAAYYPFCDYSPELVAIREAQARGVAARFIDLEFSEQCRLEDEAETADDGDEKQPDAAGDSLLEERHYRRSRYLQALAERLGCRDHEELWEHLFEADIGQVPLDAHLARVSAYCELSRVDYSEDELRADGTMQREAEMAWHIRRAVDARGADAGPDAGPVIAVVGGFHAVVLPALVAAATPRSKIPRGRVEEEASALIRYGFERLDRLNGYAAGMTAPAWHQRLWQRMLAHEKAGLAIGQRLRRDAALETLIDIALVLRKTHGIAVPTPTLAAAYEHALRLSALRRRPAPTRDDVLDAVIGCFVKGDVDSDGAIVRSVALRTLGGVTMGTVPAGAGTPPLVRDAHYRLRRQRLKIDDAQPRRSVLDIYRRPDHRISSRLLHGLSLLGVPFAVRTAGPDFVRGIGLQRLQEHWEYSYSAATEAALVEASVHGATLPLAVAQVFNRRLQRAEEAGAAVDARAAAAMAVEACVLGLHDHLPWVLDLLRAAIAADAGFESVAAAVSSLALLWESREPLEARDIPALPLLLQAAYERALYLGRELRGAQGDGGAVLEALTTLREILIGDAGRALDADLFWRMLQDLQQQHPAAVVRGGALGLRYSAGQADDSELAAALQGHLRGLLSTQEAVAYLRGLLQTAREAAWQQPALLDVIDGLLAQWQQTEFVANLPELRLAFAGMTPKETDRIAAAIAERHGIGELGARVHYDLSEADLQQHLRVSETMREVLTADGLDGWLTVSMLTDDALTRAAS